VFCFVIFHAANRPLPASLGSPKLGRKAPEFVLRDTQQNLVSLSALLSTPLDPSNPSFLESQLGLEVGGEAVDGVDAIEKVKALKPNLVVIGLAMPRMNGVEATFRLRAMMPRIAANVDCSIHDV
jgi:CheY-like chemotaxis protein